MKMNISIGVLRDHIAPICCGPNTTFRRRRHRRMGRVEHHEHGCDVLQSHKDGRRRKRVEHLGCTKYVERVREHVASMMPSRRSTPLEYHLRGESCAPRDNNASQSLSYRRAERCSPGGRRGGGGVWEGARRAADPRDRRVGSGSPRSPACSFGRRAPHRTQKHQSKTQRGVPGRRRGTSRSERERVPWGTTWRGGGKGDRKRGGRGGRGRGPPARPPRPLPCACDGCNDADYRPACRPYLSHCAFPDNVPTHLRVRRFVCTLSAVCHASAVDGGRAIRVTDGRYAYSSHTGAIATAV